MVRVKRRYLTFELIPDNPKMTRSGSLPIDERDLIRAFKDIIHTIHGDYGLGTVQKSLYIKKFCPETRMGVLTVQRGAHVYVTSSLPFLRSVKDIKCSFNSIYFSGTLRSSLKNLARVYNRQTSEFKSRLAEFNRNLQKDKMRDDDD